MGSINMVLGTGDPAQKYLHRHVCACAAYSPAGLRARTRRMRASGRKGKGPETLRKLPTSLVTAPARLLAKEGCQQLCKVHGSRFTEPGGFAVRQGHQLVLGVHMKVRHDLQCFEVTNGPPSCLQQPRASLQSPDERRGCSRPQTSAALALPTGSEAVQGLTQSLRRLGRTDLSKHSWSGRHAPAGLEWSWAFQLVKEAAGVAAATFCARGCAQKRIKWDWAGDSCGNKPGQASPQKLCAGHEGARAGFRLAESIGRCVTRNQVVGTLDASLIWYSTLVLALGGASST